MISLILLAAGNSTRFSGSALKENKLLYELDGVAMYEYAIRLARNVKIHFADNTDTEIICVTQYREIEQKLKHDITIKSIWNPQSNRGMASSICLGVSEAVGDAYLFLVCDQPWLQVHTVVSLVNAFEQSEKGIACLAYKDRLGNPTIFSAYYRQELLKLEGDVGGRQIRDRHPDDLLCIQVTDEVQLKDIDRKKDFFPENM